MYFCVCVVCLCLGVYVFLCVCCMCDVECASSDTDYCCCLFPYSQQTINEKDQIIKQLQDKLTEAKAKLDVSCPSM